MADVQLAHGYTRIANRLLAAIALAPWDSPSQLAMVLALIRCTYGLQRRDAAVGTSQWVALTGLNEGQVKRARAALEKNEVFRCVREYDPKHSIGKTWRLEKDFTLWTRYSVSIEAVENSEAIATDALTPEGGPQTTPPNGSGGYGGAENPHNPEVINTSEADVPHTLTAQGGLSTTPGGGVTDDPGVTNDPRGGAMNDPPPPPERGSTTRQTEGRKKGKERVTTYKGDGEKPEAAPDPEPPSSDRLSEVEESGDPPTEPGRIRDDAKQAFRDLTHPVSYRASWAALRAAYLYRDDGTLGNDDVKGMSIEDRTHVIETALLEYAAKTIDWNSAYFSGFVRRVLAEPKPGTEAATVRKQGEPDDREKRARARKERENWQRNVERGSGNPGPQPARISAAELAAMAGVRGKATDSPGKQDEPDSDHLTGSDAA